MQSIAIKIIANNLSERIFGTRDSSSFSPIFGTRMMKNQKKKPNEWRYAFQIGCRFFNEHCQALASCTGWRKQKAYLSLKNVREKMERAWRREARPSGGQPDLHRFERVKEPEREKLKPSFDEKLARHAASASNNHAPTRRLNWRKLWRSTSKASSSQTTQFNWAKYKTLLHTKKMSQAAVGTRTIKKRKIKLSTR